MEYVPPLNGDLGDPDRPYVNANPAAGTEGSIPPAESFEHPQREILEVIAHYLGAQAPDGGDLTQLRQAIQQAIAEALTQADGPLAGLPFPTVETAGNRLTVTPASAAAGGTVGVAAGTGIVLGEVGVSAGLGRLRRFETAAFVSADLTANATHYLRARVEAGALELYLQRGADTDPTPAGLVGTPGAAAGGGFDSTRLDALLARVVTGNAGTVPTVTALANADRLGSYGETALANYQQVNDELSGDISIALNWARRPISVHLSQSDVQNSTSYSDMDRRIFDVAIDRYALTAHFGHDYMANGKAWWSACA